MNESDQVKFSYLAIDVLTITKVLTSDESDAFKNYYCMNNDLVDFNDINDLFSDRFNPIDNGGKSVKSFDYFVDMDLILAYGFDFSVGTWFEFLGFIEKITNDDTALKTRVGHRAYERPKEFKGKNAQKQHDNKMHQINMKYKNRFSLETEEDIIKNHVSNVSKISQMLRDEVME